MERIVDLLQLGMSGLRTAQKNLQVTGHNIANVNTEGYSRQTAIQKNEVDHGGKLATGAGVYIEQIQRSYDQFAAKELTLSHTELSKTQTQQQQFTLLDEYTSQNAVHVVNSMNTFFNDVALLADNPSDLGARKIVMKDLDAIAQNFNTAESDLSRMRQDTSDKVAFSVTRMNEIGDALSTINQQLQTTDKESQLDILDEQQRLINELAQYTSVSVRPEGNNPANTILIGDGQPFVDGHQAQSLHIIAGTPDKDATQISMTLAGKEKPINLAQQGGSLEALLTFRDDTLTDSLNELGHMAIGFSEQMNQLQKAGLDGDGQAGTALFSEINSPAAQGEKIKLPMGSNADISFAITDIEALQAKDYQLTVDSTGVYRLNDEIMTSQTLPTGEDQIEWEGMTLTITTPPAVNETIEVQPVRQGAKDIRLLQTDPNQLAAQAAHQVTPAVSNQGSAEVEPLYQGTRRENFTIQITANGQQLEVLDSANNPISLLTAAGTPAQSLPYPVPNQTVRFDDGTPQGESVFTISNSAVDGDQFTLQLGRAGASSENDNLLNMKKLQTDRTMNQGQSSLIDIFEGLASNIRSQKHNTDALAQIHQMDFEIASGRVASVSGVNLDEEAANLMKFQQAYMASSRIMSVAKETFDALLRSV